MRAFPPPYRPISHLNVVSTRAYALVIAPALIVFRFSRNYFVLFFFFFFSTSLERIIRFVWKISRPSCRFCLFGSQLVRGFITHGIATRLRKSRLSDCVIQRREKKSRRDTFYDRSYQTTRSVPQEGTVFESCIIRR